MCLLFFNSIQSPAPDEYRLVLANVRDEYYVRPARVCSFWEQEPHIIGAQDLQKGREGGTWMAMNANNGKIGVLLNVLQPFSELAGDKLGRGFIVNDYLTSEETPESYLDMMSKKGDSYNGFLMVAIQMQVSAIETSFFSNFYEKEAQQLSYGTHAFGNSLHPNTPWPKVTYGKKLFHDIVSSHKRVETKEKLLQDIFSMLSDTTRFPLDEQMLQQGRGKNRDDLERLSSMFVEMPAEKYGSRTWTVILVDGNGNVDYIEKTMKEPINCSHEKVYPDWLQSDYSFKLK